jgi:hypothetical protein
VGCDVIPGVAGEAHNAKNVIEPYVRGSHLDDVVEPVGNE